MFIYYLHVSIFHLCIFKKEINFSIVINAMVNSMFAVQINSFWIGGTSLLIVVGVALDTVQQMQAHMVMRHYSGFQKQ